MSLVRAPVIRTAGEEPQKQRSKVTTRKIITTETFCYTCGIPNILLGRDKFSFGNVDPRHRRRYVKSTMRQTRKSQHNVNHPNTLH